MATQLLPAASQKLELPPPQAPPRSVHVPTVEQIRVRAYEKYCARNGAPGNPIVDWLEAERELRAAPRDPAEHPERELKLLADEDPD